MSRPLTFLCISCYYKGSDFLKACKAQGNRVYLLTKQSLADADWPRDAIDEFFYMESDANTAENLHNLANGLGWLLRERQVDRIVAIDDFDVEKAAFLREEFRIPGMGQTTARYFRDKLAMRMRAQEADIPVPTFSALFHNEDVNTFADEVEFPCLIKPRAEASATGIKKVHSKEELWRVLDELGEDRRHFLVEQFKPGDVYHVDSLHVDGKLLFCRTSRYLSTPFEVAHGGGIFRSTTLPFDGKEDRALRRLTAKVMKAFGMKFSASHTEFIRSHSDGKFYFLETSSRVGGAHLAEMVMFSSGINLWAEWAKIETAMARNEKYHLPPVHNQHTGILVSLARQEWPDLSRFAAPEVVWRLAKKHHVGCIVRHPESERVLTLLDEYAEVVQQEFHASAPAPDKSVH